MWAPLAALLLVTCCCLLGCSSEATGTASTALRGGSRQLQQAPSSSSAVGWGCYEQALPSFTRERFPFCQVLGEGRAVLYWTHDQIDRHRANISTGVSLTLALAVRVPSDEACDWVSLGLSSESGGMRGLDVAMLWVDGNNHQEGSSSFVLEDRWSEDYDTPRRDHRQDKRLLEAVVRPEQSLVAFAFSMNVTGCRGRLEEQEDIWMSGVANTFVSWAYGPRAKGSTTTTASSASQEQRGIMREQQQGAEARVPLYHGPSSRGGGPSAPLLITVRQWSRLAQADVSAPPDARVMTVAMPGVSVAHEDGSSTSYRCMWVKPPSDRPYHVYSARMVGDASVRARVMHHMILHVVERDAPLKPLGQPYDCYDDLPFNYGLPLIASSKNALLSSTDQAYAAANAARMFGDSHNTYFVLEVHYENLEGATGLVDTSGYEVVYSPTLRPHSAGFIGIGSLPTLDVLNITSPLVIPPGQSSFHRWEMCPSSCLNRRLMGGPVAVLSIGFHMHKMGTSGEVMIEHADGSVTTLVRSDRFDFKQSQMMSFEMEPLLLGHGDRIITRCTYNSTARDRITRWGPSATKDEMCLGFLQVAPMPHYGFFCTNMNGVRSPLNDRLVEMVARQRGVDHVELNLTSCLSPRQLALMARDPDKQGQISMETGATLGIPPSDLQAIEAWRSKGEDHGLDGKAANTGCAAHS